MARLTALPEIDVIHGFKGVIDFYLWRGLACARMWPRNPKSYHSAATIAAAATFGAISRAFALLANSALSAFKEDAADQTRTARDIYMSAVHGKLHEAAMSDFLDLLTECRDSLAALEALLNALGSVDTDDLQVDVKSSALPAGASTAAHQVTQNTALATIANLEEALASVATDRLQVRGEDQLFTFKEVLTKSATDTVTGDDGWVQSPPVPAGQLWVVTTVYAADNDRAIAGLKFGNRHDGSNIFFFETVQPILIRTGVGWAGHTILDPADTIIAYYHGALDADNAPLFITGYIMTLEP